MIRHLAEFVDTILVSFLHKKMKFSIKDFFSKCDQIRSLLRIWPHLLNKSLMENFIFCAVQTTAIHILPNISQSKDNQTMKYDLFIEYNERNIFL